MTLTGQELFERIVTKYIEKYPKYRSMHKYDWERESEKTRKLYQEIADDINAHFEQECDKQLEEAGKVINQIMEP